MLPWSYDFSPHEPILVKAHTTVTVNRCKHAIFPNLPHLVKFFGLGASSRLQEAVFSSKAAVEWSSPLADLHRKIQASVNWWTKGTFVRCKLWSKWKKHIRGPQPFCHVNPFGNRGGLQGGEDIRASTAPAVRQAFRLQVPRLLLPYYVFRQPALLSLFVKPWTCSCVSSPLSLRTLELPIVFDGGLLTCLSWGCSNSGAHLGWSHGSTNQLSWELSAFRVCKLVQPAEFRLTCNGLMASLSGFVSWFSADLGCWDAMGRMEDAAVSRSIHRKWSTFKWLQRRAVVRLKICKSVFFCAALPWDRWCIQQVERWFATHLHGHCARACELRFCLPVGAISVFNLFGHGNWLEASRGSPSVRIKQSALLPDLSKHAQWKVERGVSRMHPCNQGAEVVAQQQIWSVQICPEVNAS